MQRLIGLISLWFVVPAAVVAAPIFTAVCDEPKGPRIDFGRYPVTAPEPELRRTEDSYTGVKPVFLIDSDSPQILTYVWGHSEKSVSPPGVSLPPTEAKQSAIVVRSPDFISAVERYGDHRVSVFSLYLKLGLGVFTDHTYTDVLGPYAKAVTFTSRCQFSPTQ